MINIAICDDEHAETEYLRTIISAWAKEEKQPIHISSYPSAEAFLFVFAENKQYDLLLLDIQMGLMDGVTLAKKIRAENKEMPIIFVTGYMDYLTDGYDVEALHYLLKPVTKEKLSGVLNKAVEKLARNARALFINHSGESVRIPLYEIRYLEVLGNYVTIHAHDRYTVKKPLSALAEALDRGFFRAGRSYIVNLKYVRRSTKTEIHLLDGTIIPLSRGRYEALHRAIIEN